MAACLEALTYSADIACFDKLLFPVCRSGVRFGIWAT